MLKLFTALVIAGVSIGGTNASNPNPTSTTIITENSDKWVEVQNENGIKIFFSKFELNNQSYLKIKFENTTTQSVELTFDIKKQSELFVKGFSTSIGAQTSIELTDYNSIVIAINNGETCKDFSIVTNFK